MSNDWFLFRQFMIRQEHAAMKVGTDGVLLGAWAGCGHCGSVLDIGTGTGLLALMVAQKNPDAAITAVEIDEDAAGQAFDNAKASPWTDRIEVIHADFRTWALSCNRFFELIICNPPYFTHSLKNPDSSRSRARHDDDMPLDDLVSKSAALLTQEGRLVLILPAGRQDEAIGYAAANKLFLQRRLDVRGNANAPVRRILLEWGRKDAPVEMDEMVIEGSKRGDYSEKYRGMTGEFYL